MSFFLTTEDTEAVKFISLNFKCTGRVSVKRVLIKSFSFNLLLRNKRLSLDILKLLKINNFELSLIEIRSLTEHKKLGIVTLFLFTSI